MSRGQLVAHLLGAALLLCLLQQAVGQIGTDPGPWGIGIALLQLTTGFAGWAIAVRRPRIALGWILLAIPLMFGVQGPASALAEAIGPSPASEWLQWIGTDSPWNWIPPIGLLLTQLPLRFPDGALPSPRWRAFSWITVCCVVLSCAVTATTTPTTAAGVANPTFVRWGDATDLVSGIGSLVLVPAGIGSLASLFVRYRRAGDVQRAQLRWFAWAIAVVVTLLVLGWGGQLLFAEALGPAATTVADVWTIVTGLSYSLIPIAVLFAVLRRGLYSIDRIISRTAAYLVVTVVVGGGYAAVVLLVTAALPALQGPGVALTTLAAAAVFLPVLRRVRRRVDRIFNRTQYDAERVVAAFGERIRTGADPHTAGADLVSAVERSLDPVSVGLWVRP